MRQKQSSTALIAVLAVLAIFLVGAGAVGTLAYWRMVAVEQAREAEFRAREAMKQAERAAVEAERQAYLLEEAEAKSRQP